MKAPDQHIRQQALDITQSFIVQAPAGSGKTELLIQRYLALLAVADEPEEVMAITFTRKAVAEMRHRVLQALRQTQYEKPTSDHAAQTWELAAAVMQRSVEQDWNLDMQPARLRILTIDALNALLVRRMPWLSGIGMDAALESQPSYLYEEAAWDTLSRRDTTADISSHIETLLLHLDNQDRRVASMLSELLAKRDQWLRYLIPLKHQQKSADARQLLTRMFESLLEEEVAKIFDVAELDILDELIRLASTTAQRLHEEGKDTAPHLICKDLKQIPDSEYSSLVYWKALAKLYLTEKGAWRTPRGVNARYGFPPKSEEKNAYTVLYENLEQNEFLRIQLAQIKDYPDTIYDDEQWSVLEALIELLPTVVAQLQLVFKRHSAIDFVEQSMAAQRALGQGDEITDLNLKLDYQLRHILMDEFQDTSHSQFTLLERLIEGWQPDEGRTLFLVGDPMQSIYLFREADVSGFLSVRDHGIGAVRPVPLVLETNFRSTSTLVDWFNNVFPDVLAPQDDIALGAVSYSPAVAIHEDTEATSMHASIVMDRTAEQEAVEITEVIKNLNKEDTDQSIGILVRSRRHLYDLFYSLETENIQFNAVDIKPLLHQPAIQDLLSITRTLLHRHDRIAWLAILRAPWCGLTLNGLHQILADQPENDIWTLLNNPQLMTMLSDDEANRVQRIIDAYRDIYYQNTTLSLHTKVEWLWHRLGAAVCHSDSEEEAQVFMRELATLEKHNDSLTHITIEKHLQDLFSNRINSHANVQLMTIHKSKGLQFDTVIIPALDRGVRPNSRDLLVWHEERSNNYEERLLLAPIPNMAGQDDSFDYVRKREQQRAHYEYQRLLYVAMTRAKQRLFLYASVKSNSEGEPQSARQGSFLALLGDHIEVDTNDGLSDAVQTEEEINEEAETVYLKRLTADWTPECQKQNIQWAQDVQKVEELTPIEFSWAGQSARLTGMVVHHYLQLISEQGISNWSEERLQLAAPSIESLLIGEGLPRDRLSGATKFVIQTLNKVLSSERAQWITADYAESHSEYAISGLIDGRIVNRVIDRTFVDEAGVRWIIDYKTSTHLGSGLNAFLDEEQRRYHEQLSNYAELFAGNENREIRCGLYFPVMDAWREWRHTG